jgi:hypothetical protein
MLYSILFCYIISIYAYTYFFASFQQRMSASETLSTGARRYGSNRPSSGLYRRNAAKYRLGLLASCFYNLL